MSDLLLTEANIANLVHDFGAKVIEEDPETFGALFVVDCYTSDREVVFSLLKHEYGPRVQRFSTNCVVIL